MRALEMNENPHHVGRAVLTFLSPLHLQIRHWDVHGEICLGGKARLEQGSDTWAVFHDHEA